MKLRSAFHFLLLTLFAATGCKSLTPTSWQYNPSINTLATFETGRDTDAPVLSLNCISEFGAHHMLAGLQGFKERARNLDRFIASLDLECVKYVEFGGEYVQAPSNQPAPVTLTNHLFFRTNNGEQPIKVAADAYPTGLFVTHNGHDYVMNLNLIFETRLNLALTFSSPPVMTQRTISDYPQGTNIGGPAGQSDAATLTCGPQEVLTGLRIRADEGNGKIRFVGLECQAITISN